MRFIVILISLTIAFSCEQKKKKELKIEEKYPKVYSDGLEAHGGLDNWNSFGTLKFNELSGKDTILHILDLKNRNEIIQKSGQYKVGYTSDSIYFYPNRESFPGKEPRFYHNLRFYFFAMPFVTADPGANQEVLDPKVMMGEECNRVKITYGDGIGLAPKDQYILWFGKKDNLLKMINYSVTYYNEKRAENYNAIVFSKWEEINGLKMPVEMIGHKWENDSLGEERYRKHFNGISFSIERPDPSIFMNLSVE